MLTQHTYGIFETEADHLIEPVFESSQVGTRCSIESKRPTEGSCLIASTSNVQILPAQLLDPSASCIHDAEVFCLVSITGSGMMGLSSEDETASNGPAGGGVVSSDLPIEVELQELPGVCFIVAHDTGVLYWHQCGGLACAQNALQGFLVPCSQSEAVNEQLYWHFYEGPKYKGHCHAGLDEDDAVLLDRLLASMGFAGLSVDRQRLCESIEAWVYLKVDSDLPCVPCCYNSNPASTVVMIWENSD